MTEAPLLADADHPRRMRVVLAWWLALQERLEIRAELAAHGLL